jgi:hypothetical protein
MLTEMLQWGFEGSKTRLDDVVDCDEDHCFRAGDPLDLFCWAKPEAAWDAVAAYPRRKVLVPEIAPIHKDMIEAG